MPYPDFNSPASDAVEEAYLDIVVHSRSGSEDKDSNDGAAHGMQHEVNPYSADYEQQDMRPNEADVRATMSKRDMIWSYLRLQTCGSLRKMGLLGAVNVRHNERKSIACALTMLRISKAASLQGVGIEEWLCSNEKIQFSSSTIESFFFDSKRCRSVLCTAPCDSDLERFMPTHVREEPRRGQRGTSTVARATPFTLSEFTRLVMILVDDESVRRGLLATAQARERSEIDRSVPHHDIWVSTIAPLFNNTSHVVPSLPGAEVVLSSKSALGKLSVDVNVRPCAIRDGAALRNVFEKTRVLFTRVHANWAKSGNLDTLVGSFLGELVTFLPVRPGGGIPAVTEEARRVAILFVAYRVGTPSEVTDLIHFTSRAAPDDVGLEESVVADEQAKLPPRRKRKRGQNMHSQQTSGFDKGAADMMATSVATIATEIASSRRVRGGRAAQEAANADELLSLLHKATESYSKTDNPAMRKRWRKQIERLEESLDIFEKDEQASDHRTEENHVEREVD
jgi:hypothetical protein